MASDGLSDGLSDCLPHQVWWMAAQSVIALAEATGALSPLFTGARALLRPRIPQPPPPTAAGAPEGACSAPAAAPGMGHRYVH